MLWQEAGSRPHPTHGRVLRGLRHAGSLGGRGGGWSCEAHLRIVAVLARLEAVDALYGSVRRENVQSALLLVPAPVVRNQKLVAVHPLHHRARHKHPQLQVGGSKNPPAAALMDRTKCELTEEQLALAFRLVRLLLIRRKEETRRCLQNKPVHEMIPGPNSVMLARHPNVARSPRIQARHTSEGNNIQCACRNIDNWKMQPVTRM